MVQDIVDYVAMSPDGDPLAALDTQIATKLVPQLAGPASVARALLDLVNSLRTTDLPFAQSTAAIGQLLSTEDPSSGLVYFRY